MLEEHKYDEETKKGCLTIDPSEYLQYISVDKDSMSALLDDEIQNWDASLAETQQDVEE